LTRVSWHFSFFTTDGKSAVNPRRDKESTNHRLVLIDMNLAHNVFITDIVCSGVLRVEIKAFVFCCIFSVKRRQGKRMSLLYHLDKDWVQ